MHKILFLIVLFIMLKCKKCSEDGEEEVSTRKTCLITESNLQVAFKFFKEWEEGMQETSVDYNCVANCNLKSKLPLKVAQIFETPKIPSSIIASDFKLLDHCRSLGRRVKLHKLYPSRKQIYVHNKFKASWSFALKYCRKLGLELGSLQNSKINQEVKEFLDLEYEQKDMYFWVGGSNIPGGGLKFTWLENSAVISELEVNKKSLCVALYYNGNTHKLITQDCQTYSNFFCEVPNYCYPKITYLVAEVAIIVEDITPKKSSLSCKKAKCPEYEIIMSQSLRGAKPELYNTPRTGCGRRFLMGKTTKSYEESRVKGCCVYQMHLWSPTSDADVLCVAKLYSDYMKSIGKTWVWTSGSDLGSNGEYYKWCDTNEPISKTMTWKKEQSEITAKSKKNTTKCVIGNLDIESNNVGIQAEKCTAMGPYLCQSIKPVEEDTPVK